MELLVLDLKCQTGLVPTCSETHPLPAKTTLSTLGGAGRGVSVCGREKGRPTAQRRWGEGGYLMMKCLHLVEFQSRRTCHLIKALSPKPFP